MTESEVEFDGLQPDRSEELYNRSNKRESLKLENAIIYSYQKEEEACMDPTKRQLFDARDLFESFGRKIFSAFFLK